MTPDELEAKADELVRQINYDNLVYGRSGIIVDKDTNEVRVARQEELDDALADNNIINE